MMNQSGESLLLFSVGEGNTHSNLQNETFQSLNNSIHWRHLLSTQLFKGYPDWMLMSAFVCCVMFLICGLPGNIITILALVRCKKVRNTTAIFIINLSVSDLLFCCFNLPLAASKFLTKRWVWGPQLCQLYPLLRYGLLGVSIFNILAITINRYVMIAHPYLYNRMYSSRWLPLHVASTWIFGFVFLVPTSLSVWGQFGLDLTVGSCTIILDENGRSAKEFLFVFAFLSPCLAIIVCYARIFCIAHQAAQKSSEKKEVKISVEAGKLLETEGKLVANIEYSSSIPSSSQFSTSSVQSKDTITTQISRATLEPPSPFPQAKNQSPLSVMPSEITTNNNTRRTSTVSFSFRRNSITPNGLQRDGTRRKSLRPGRLSQKDRRLLKMILVIFVSFLVCYLPITIVKIVGDPSHHFWFLLGYILIYLSTCTNPIIYVLMSTEYRQAYFNLLTCHNSNTNGIK